LKKIFEENNAEELKKELIDWISYKITGTNHDDLSKFKTEIGEKFII